MMETIQTWLTFVLQLLVAGLSVLVVGLAVAFKSATSPGAIGIAMNVILSISSTLVYLMQPQASFETSLGAIARIKALDDTLASEDKEGEDFEPSIEWPEKGAIEFQNVVAAYKYDKSTYYFQILWISC